MGRMKFLAKVKLVAAGIGLFALMAAGLPARAAEGGGAGQGPYLLIAPIDVPIIESGSLAGHLVVELAIKTKTPGEAQAMSARMPQLRSLALVAVSEFAQLYVSGYRPVRAVELRANVEAALRPHDPRIEQVLVLNLMAKPPR